MVLSTQTTESSSSTAVPTKRNSVLENANKVSNLDITKIVGGAIVEEYECAHNYCNGTLYVGMGGLCFLGRIFFFEWTVALKWNDILQVQKSNDGIQILMRSPENAIYQFTELANQDRVWGVLVTLHNDAIVDYPSSGNGTTPSPVRILPSRQSLRRMNSDPIGTVKTSLFVRNDDDDDDINNDNDTDHAVAAAAAGRKNVQTTGSSKSHGKNEKEHRKGVSVPVGTMSLIAQSASSSSKDKKTTVKTTIKKDTEVNNDIPSSKQQVETVAMQWTKIMDGKTNSYSKSSVCAHILPCNLDMFIDLFVLDDAKYSMKSFMENNGDEEIQISHWKKEQQEKTMDTTTANTIRTIEYTHPVNAPMAPPKARARKEQVLKRFDNYGLVLETKTFVSDVPMTDCFYVIDRIRVQPCKTDPQKVELYIDYDIKFVKSTMFRSIIASTTNKEFEAFTKRLATFMSKMLGEEAVAVHNNNNMSMDHANKFSVTESTSNSLPQVMTHNFTVPLLLILVMLQLWSMMEMKAMKYEIHELQMSLVLKCVE